MDLWKEWVCDFSHRDLTFGKDQLPALAGITQQISKKINKKIKNTAFAMRRVILKRIFRSAFAGDLRRYALWTSVKICTMKL
jgi:hypothetical protein